MSKIFVRFCLATIIGGLSTIPAFSNVTDFTISSNVEEILTVELERVSNSNVVSSDDMHPTVNLPVNEVLNFGSVNALGLSPTSNTSIGNNGTTGMVQSRVYNTTGNIDLTSEPKTSTYEGAVYFVEDALQIRTIRSGTDLTTDIEIDNVGDMKAVIANQSTYDWSTANNITPNIVNNNGSYFPLVSNVANSTPYRLDIGILIPSSLTTGNKQTVITFTGS